jgi:hypothetical protein
MRAMARRTEADEARGMEEGKGTCFFLICLLFWTYGN